MALRFYGNPEGNPQKPLETDKSALEIARKLSKTSKTSHNCLAQVRTLEAAKIRRHHPGKPKWLF